MGWKKQTDKTKWMVTQQSKEIMAAIGNDEETVTINGETYKIIKLVTAPRGDIK